jgi:hypothetical protein
MDMAKTAQRRPCPHHSSQQMRTPNCFNPRRRIQPLPRRAMRHDNINWICGFRSGRNRVRRNIRRIRERCARSVEAVFVHLVRESPVPELGRVRAGVDICYCSVGQRDLVNTFVKICYAFQSRSAIVSRPQVSRSIHPSVSLFVAEAGRLATLGILLAVSDDEVTVQGEIVVPSYHQFAEKW